MSRMWAGLIAMCSLVFGSLTPAWAIGYGEVAPDFSLVSTTGETYTLSQYRGQVVFLNFFGWS
ncbi:peroxiredoxin family protein [bacterium]|nr:peroxiredoxin family protein [bacterium]MBU1982953.1 peroxiredoxin family protein [bacterium]